MPFRPTALMFIEPFGRFKHLTAGPRAFLDWVSERRTERGLMDDQDSKKREHKLHSFTPWSNNSRSASLFAYPGPAANPYRTRTAVRAESPRHAAPLTGATEREGRNKGRQYDEKDDPLLIQRFRRLQHPALCTISCLFLSPLHLFSGLFLFSPRFLHFPRFPCHCRVIIFDYAFRHFSLFPYYAILCLSPLQFFPFLAFSAPHSVSH